MTAIPAQAQLRVSSDFPGGSGKVESIDQEARVIRMVPSEGPGWDSWWYVRVDGVRPGEGITFDVGGGVWATPDRAVFRTGDGEWKRTAAGSRDGGRVVFRQQIDSESAWFAWGEPFLLDDAVTLVRRTAAESPAAESFVLATSREGRPVPALRITESGVSTGQETTPSRQPLEGDGRFSIWIQARQHAWEAGSSWVCRGFVEWLISGDPRAEGLRRMAVIHVVPIMDVDNVERGAGGKDQRPHDHNRDWTDDPHWPEVRAAQKRIREIVEADGLDVFIDLHNPHPRERDVYFFVTPEDWMTPAQSRNRARFLALVEEEMKEPLPFLGRIRDSAVETTARTWVTRNTTGHVVALTLEAPWNSPDSVSKNYRETGRQLGLAIGRFLRERDESASGRD